MTAHRTTPALYYVSDPDSGYYYKVVAVDVHGNESAFALLGPQDVPGAGGPGPIGATYLAQNYPNPFNPSTTIGFGLAEPGNVSLRGSTIRAGCS